MAIDILKTRRSIEGTVSSSPARINEAGMLSIPDGWLATVVTYLGMRELPPLRETNLPTGMAIEIIKRPDPAWYRDLFRRVGEDWLWFSRLRMSDAELRAILNDPAVDVFALVQGDEAKGLLELDRRRPPDIEIAFLGVTRDLIGRGAGRALMQHAINEARAHSPKRLWLHTCTLDHPRALEFYIGSGFRPYKRAVEVSPDPRLTGDLPVTAAPHIPLLALMC